MLPKIMLAGISLILAAAPAEAANWGHWRGESGNGTASAARPPIAWSPTTNVKWKVPIAGRGTGSPIIWNDQVFAVTAVEAASVGDAAASANDAQGRRFSFAERSRPRLRFELLCFHRTTGKLRWRRTAIEAAPHEETHPTHGYASASPCTDGKHVYAHFGSRGLYCYTMDGEFVWQRDFGSMRILNGFGEGSSPTLSGDKIIVPWDHEGQSYLYALDKLTGETIWRAERDEPTCWSTPLVIEHNGQEQIVMNGQNYARAHDLDTGRELWRCGGQTQRPAASAVANERLVFVGSGFRGSFLGAFRPDGSGDIEGSPSVVWTIGRDTPDIPSPLLSDGRLYFFKGKTGRFSCVDAATGRAYYTAQRIGISNVYASPIAAGGHVYLCDRNGTTVVIEDSAELKIVAKNSLGETIDATPAPVDNELFIRGEEHLFCIAE